MSDISNAIDSLILPFDVKFIYKNLLLLYCLCYFIISHPLCQYILYARYVFEFKYLTYRVLFAIMYKRLSQTDMHIIAH